MASPAGRAFRCIFYRRMPLQSHDAEKWMVIIWLLSEIILLVDFLLLPVAGGLYRLRLQWHFFI
ncbi:hypothetical protein CKK33_18570 [Mucilaginibacter sp. MD40]|nr:hypothetical protein CKK33_18570 [Mucilaginibacter sp. MD40]